MLRRTRTTKKLAKRIDLQYFSRPHALRSWRLWLSIAVPLLAAGWFGVQYARGGQAAYSSGPLASAHALFTKQCSLCHVSQAGAFFKHVSDQACLTCHDAPAHQADQAFTPECSSCHLEHRGALSLTATSDSSCTQCHANLHGHEGQGLENVSGLDRGHPEFAVLRSGRADAGTIRLNHYLHLQPGLMGPSGTRVQMICEDCHRSQSIHQTETQATPVSLEASNPREGTHRRVRSGGGMVPIAFSQDCASCHTLQFDRRFGNLQVPHDKTEIVHQFLVKQFTEYAATHTNAFREVEPTISRDLPGVARPVRIAHSTAEWISFRVEDAEFLLWAKTCKQCHALSTRGSSLPEIEQANITQQWLPHATFDHRAHRMMTCGACHAKTAESHETSDVLLPGISICRQCHRQAGASQNAAEGRCFECHEYHDWSKSKPTKGRFSIPQLLGELKIQP